MSERGPGRIVAPGKLILIGEYAVVHGGPAVVLAVDRAVTLDWREPDGVLGADLVDFARRACARKLHLSGDLSPCRADSSAFYKAGTKLGLGSSAAVVTAAVASIFCEAGADIEDRQVRERIWGCAREIHDAFQGVAGSGLDLAAATFGGWLVMDPRRPDQQRFCAWRPPVALELVFVWTGRVASTAGLVGAVERYRRDDPQGFAARLRDMVALVDVFLAARDARAALGALGAYGEQMARLGACAQAAIARAPILALMEAARRLGGAAKPSGAGGGDFVVAAFADRAAAHAYRRSAEALGAVPMEFGMDPRGVRWQPVEPVAARDERTTQP